MRIDTISNANNTNFTATSKGRLSRKWIRGLGGQTEGQANKPISKIREWFKDLIEFMKEHPNIR